ncbi:putative beta-galactosidase [Kockovaella imperatae]|uniref:beta-galactosidase n=1 Tax=Kockovaella imperatae TaxID=4999 RepID=A0A1Y1UMM0_9TREE|nr:putative beta-galactosidase [Kockovaella imperatae]ORX39232.1 putative beta-galactosidase [Kockovaella imperatae]
MKFPEFNDKLFYGADYNPEQWPRHVWDEDIKLMKEAHVNVVSLAIFSWAVLEPTEGQWEFEWLDEIIELCHKNGIAVDLATATASPPPWLTTKHPEILPQTEQFGVQVPGARQHWRPTSPIYRQYAEKLITKLAQRYGDHPAVIAWHINNELGCHNLLDFSDDAARAFRIFLKKRYGSLGKLNEAWATAFWSQRYSTFEEILPPRSPQSAATFANPTQQLDWRRFCSAALEDWLVFEVETIRKHSSRPITTNFMLAGAAHKMDYAKWADQIDFVSNDHYRMQSIPYEREDLSFAASISSGMAKGQPWWLMEHSTSAVNWQQVNIAKRPGEMARDSLTHLAYGADAICYFQWRQSKGGAEKFHSSMVPHAGPDSRLFKDVVALGQHLVDLKEIRGSEHVSAPVAIILDTEAWMGSSLDSHPSSLIDYQSEAFGWFVALMNLGIRADVLPLHSADLAKHKFVIAPMLYSVSDATIAKVDKYVRHGGHFLTTYFSGIVDENDHARLGGYPGAWRELLGIRVEEFAPLLRDQSVKLDNGTRGTLWTEPIDLIAKDVSVVQTYAEGDFKGMPASTMRPVDKGTASYISTCLDVDGKTGLLDALFHKVDIKSPLPSSLLGKIEHVIRATEDKSWTFLINRTEEAIDLGELKGDLVISTTGHGRQLGPRGVVVLRDQL